MQKWKYLKPGDIVDIVAPCSYIAGDFNAIKEFFAHWGLVARWPSDIETQPLSNLGTGHRDEYRLETLKAALYADDSSAVWIYRGGYGATRLLEALTKLEPPTHAKLLIGFSDITALLIFLTQKWHWNTMHGEGVTRLIKPDYDPEILQETHDLVFGIKAQQHVQLTPLNDLAREQVSINTSIIGGNLCLVQSSLGTFWEIDTKGKILFLEDVNEVGYRIDRMLTQLKQSQVVDNAQAVIFGEFTEGQEKGGGSYVQAALADFANLVSVPVLSCKLFGHTLPNRALPMGSEALLVLGDEPYLNCTSGGENFA